MYKVQQALKITKELLFIQWNCICSLWITEFSDLDYDAYGLGHWLLICIGFFLQICWDTLYCNCSWRADTSGTSRGTSHSSAFSNSSGAIEGFFNSSASCSTSEFQGIWGCQPNKRYFWAVLCGCKQVKNYEFSRPACLSSISSCSGFSKYLQDTSKLQQMWRQHHIMNLMPEMM